MAKDRYELKTIIRARSARVISDAAFTTFCHLDDNQPLLLERDPGNPVDPNAVLVSDLYGSPCGYVAREHAAEVSGKLAAKEILMAKAVGPCICIARRIVIWSDGEAEREVEEEFKIDRSAKADVKYKREYSFGSLPSK